MAEQTETVEIPDLSGDVLEYERAFVKAVKRRTVILDGMRASHEGLEPLYKLLFETLQSVSKTLGSLEERMARERPVEPELQIAFLLDRCRDLLERPSIQYGRIMGNAKAQVLVSLYERAKEGRVSVKEVDFITNLMCAFAQPEVGDLAKKDEEGTKTNWVFVALAFGAGIMAKDVLKSAFDGLRNMPMLRGNED